MWNPIIGENAGKIWQVLSEKGTVSITVLKKETKLDDNWLYLGLGWLAREDKMAFILEGRQVKVALKE
ncbi:winged helix-turn-helix domain-containing protein [candidate division TA06 bacterium]|uniref:Winged helix-turn-helix domain-containing protein n=1 Tax=candidate division TA06 bacterium TaxID=2250710 RepID=A0A933IAH1_UNCT6|nr:winged helix-turn-helix domain-containing protein [candidate division TA06 bacterium]